MARPRPKIAAALKDQLSVAVNNGLVPFVRFGVSVGNQRVGISLLTHVAINSGIVCRAISVRPANLAPALFLCNRAHN